MSAGNWPIVPALNDDDDDDDGVCGANRMRIGRGKRSTWRKLVPVTLWPLHILHYLSWTRTRAAAVRRRRLTA
jgi:hypothetical protein